MNASPRDCGFSTCSTYESCPDSPSWDRRIPKLMDVVCIGIQRGYHKTSLNTAGYHLEGIVHAAGTASVALDMSIIPFGIIEVSPYFPVKTGQFWPYTRN